MWDLEHESQDQTVKLGSSTVQLQSDGCLVLLPKSSAWIQTSEVNKRATGEEGGPKSKLRPVLTVFVDAAWRGLEKLWIQIAASWCYGMETKLEWTACTHWRCYVCTEDRCAAAAARGPHTLCGTHGDTAAPVNTGKTRTQQQCSSKSRKMHSFTSNSAVTANLVVVEWFQTDSAVVCIDGLGRLTP